MSTDVDTATGADITALATVRWAGARERRLSTTMQALVRHLHQFAREVVLTESEWAAAMLWLTRVGQISDDKRAEFILASDVLGLSMLVVELNHLRDSGATPATVLGPFYTENAPALEFGADMAEGVPGIPLYITGTLRDLSGCGIEGGVLDVWQADSQGLYDSQRGTGETRLRGRYNTRSDGSFCLRTVPPLGYSIPMDGPVGELVSRAGISHYRPAHLHLRVTAPGYDALITHLFEKGAPYLDSDAVFGTKEQLVVPFERRTPGPTPDGGRSEVPWLLAQYDFVLQGAAAVAPRDE
ncbi:hydroxyquinol 1,2-dioxygenase [Mycolicibacterium sp. 3033]|nr:hydroxyquinol 1,2-dioxygenase [Mycolicibacterium aurantiacum]